MAEVHYQQARAERLRAAIRRCLDIDVYARNKDWTVPEYLTQTECESIAFDEVLAILADALMADDD